MKTAYRNQAEKSSPPNKLWHYIRKYDNPLLILFSFFLPELPISAKYPEIVLKMG